MTTQKEKNKNIRKLTRVGKTSLAVTIPVEFVEKMGLRERQKVVLSLHGKKIIIQDWPKAGG